MGWRIKSRERKSNNKMEIERSGREEKEVRIKQGKKKRKKEQRLNNDGKVK